jgi:S1-C subfamily serine protease
MVSAGVCIYPSVCIPGEVGTYYFNAIFHSAPIFPGDSGGPLVDLEGRLVAIHGGFVNDSASVAPSIEAIMPFLHARNGELDPGHTVRGSRALPVRWPASSPGSFEESTRWTIDSVADTLVEVYAPGERTYVLATLKRIRVRYLSLRAKDPRSDADLVRAMLGEIFEALTAHQQSARMRALPAPPGARARWASAPQVDPPAEERHLEFAVAVPAAPSSTLRPAEALSSP